jgi:replicative DNA helicase
MSNMEAERAYLGCVSVDPGLLDRTRLVVEDFASPVNQVLFEALRTLHDSGRPADDIILLDDEIGDALTDKEKMDFHTLLCSDFGYINLTSGEHYADLIIEASDRRSFTEALARAAKVGLSGKLAIDEATAVLEAGISHRQKTTVSLAEAAGNVWRQAEEYHAHPLPPGMVRNLDTGWADLNSRIGGWSPGLHIIEAVPHVGKSWLVFHTASHACTLGKHVLLFPLEHSQEQSILRMCWSYAKVRKSTYEAGKMTPQQYAAFSDRLGQMVDWNLTIDDTAASLAQVTTAIRKAHRIQPLDLVIIDPLGLLAREKSENRNVQLGTVTGELKLLSREINAPIIVPHHVSDKEINRRSNKRPTAADPYESGHINQNADLLLGLYRDDMYDENSSDKNVLEILLLKDREGGETGGRVYLWCDEFGNMKSITKDEDPTWRGGE